MMGLISHTNARKIICGTEEKTFGLGAGIGAYLKGGEIIFLSGGLGAGKTIFTKGILSALDFDIDDVTSPSFALVNLYKAEDHDVYHIDLWRIDESNDPAFAVGLDEILEDDDAIVIIEWAERLGKMQFDREVIRIEIEGDGDAPRMISIS
ncbi:MAG: tRNA (adenosine(37)-N6)-threonylcarbamoyltransferase complex ATPase subunit type 1 TsaE [Pyrinomonadaceae bacterium]